jgi:hypothetical protein
MPKAPLRLAEEYLLVLADLLLMYSDCSIFHIHCASSSECVTFFVTCLVLPTLCSKEHKTPRLCIKAFMCTYNGLSVGGYHSVCGGKILLYLDIDMNEESIALFKSELRQILFKFLMQMT